MTIDTPHAARKHGIGMVYQELSLFPERSVLANLFVNREPMRRGLVSPRAMEDECRACWTGSACMSTCEAPVSRLSIGERQLVELCRVLLEDAAPADPRRAQFGAQPARDRTAVHGAAAACAQRGITMLYVSHRLEEVFAISDRVTVTRNGRDVLAEDRRRSPFPR